MRQNTLFLFFIFLTYSTASIAATTAEKENYKNVLKTAAVFQTKSPEYYEKIVQKLAAENNLNGDMSRLDKAVSGLFGPAHVQDYQRLAIELYSQGYAEESYYITMKYVEPTKTYTPEQALEKARALSN
jgi:hypothetical protein